jgi:hypothetical protein
MESRPQRPRWFIAAIWAFALLVIGLQIGVAASTFVPAVSSGVVLGPDYQTVVGVAPKWPAARAGIRIGDKLLPSAGRAALIEELKHVRKVPGEPLTLDVARDDRAFSVTLVPQCCRSLAQIDSMDGLYALTQLFVVIVSMLIAAFLASARPGLMTFAFLLAMPNTGLDGTIPGLPREVNVWVYALSEALTYNGLWFALPIFGVRFPTDTVTGWQVKAQSVCIGVLIFAQSIVTLSAIYDGIGGNVSDLGLFGNETAGRILVIGSALAVVATIAFLSLRYAEATPTMRMQIRWARIGTIVALLVLTAQILDYALPTWRDTELFLSINGSFVVLLPICVAYALMRVRFVNPSFVLNRATAVALTGAILATAVGTFHWITTKFVEARGFAIALEALVTIALGFSLTILHGRAEAAVERFLFARRHAAFDYLRRLGVALSAATRRAAVEDALAVDVPRELSLASGAAFRRDPQRRTYLRAAATGWEGARCTEIPGDDTLVAFLTASGAPLRTEDCRWARPDLPRGPEFPVLAVPIMIRGEVAAFALYGAHRDASEIDKGEVRELGVLAEHCSAALDHVEASHLREELAELERRYLALLERVSGAKVESLHEG